MHYAHDTVHAASQFDALPRKCDQFIKGAIAKSGNARIILPNDRLAARDVWCLLGIGWAATSYPYPTSSHGEDAPV